MSYFKHVEMTFYDIIPVNDDNLSVSEILIYCLTIELKELLGVYYKGNSEAVIWTRPKIIRGGGFSFSQIASNTVSVPLTTRFSASIITESPGESLIPR